VTESPFPGMDPWLEQFWGDVHHRLVNYACDQLEEYLPTGLVAHLEERVYVEIEEEGRQPRIPDVVVVQQGSQGGPALKAPSGVAVAEPLRVRLKPEPVRQGFIQIIDPRSGGRVITVIEVLNKRPGAGQRMYLSKQQELHDSGVSLVEIDLLRSGERVLSVRPEMLPPSHRTAYQVCVRRAADPDFIDVYRITLRERLPAIPIPLRQNDSDLPLDLQPLLEQIYRKGRYRRIIDYGADPESPLDGDDAMWADQLLRSKGIR